MLEVQGRYNTAKVFTDLVDQESRKQIVALCDQEFAAGSRIRLMPDVHAGAGCTIGTTMTIRDKIVPNLVGVDIGCGMETIRLEERALDLEALDRLIHTRIPAGFAIRDKTHRYFAEIDLKALHCLEQVNYARAEKSLGTLGGGNHFIEANQDSAGRLYLVVHSGSRHLGLQVAKYYQKRGYKENPQIDKDLAYVSGELFDSYLHDMRLVQRFAALNRRAMVDEIVQGLGLTVAEQFTTIHNYIDIEQRILRKGAVSAQAGEMLLIPINMRDGSLICRGKGNPDWNYSAPHGAGRLMSRAAAKKRFTVQEFTAEMREVYTTTVNASTLDECPMAYKSMQSIVDNITPTAEIVEVIRPIYNFKAAE